MSFFRAHASATQSISGSTETELVFGTELSDPDSVFASNKFTVPSGWNGRIGALSAGFHNPNSETPLQLRIQKQTGGTGSFVTIAETSWEPRYAGTVSAYPVVFETGDVYRVAYFGSATTKSNGTQNYFAGWSYPASPTKIGMLRAERTTSNLSLSANALRLNEMNTEIIDSHSFHASGIITVPSAFNGGFLHLTGGFVAIDDAPAIIIERSTDGGSNWTRLGEVAIPTGCIVGCVDGGAIAAVTAEKFRFVSFVSGSNFTLVAEPRSFFAGLFVKY